VDDERRSNRPTPRTPAAIEAELRRRLRTELAQAREEAGGELDDAALAGIIGRAIAVALGWHLEGPEHTRNATLSSRTWRGASGPRGGGPPRDRDRDFDQGPGGFDDRGRPSGFEDRGRGGGFDDRRRPGRPIDRGPRERPSGEWRPPPRGQFRPRGYPAGNDEERDWDEGQDTDERPPRRYPSPRGRGPQRPGGPGGPRWPSSGGPRGGRPPGRGGFGPRRPR
jgi:hypothetical protein